MALKQYFYIVLVPLKFIPKRTASFWQTIKIPNRFVLKICTGGFADYTFSIVNGRLFFSMGTDSTLYQVRGNRFEPYLRWCIEPGKRFLSERGC